MAEGFQCSDRFEVRQSAKKGRCLYARRKFVPNDIILEESPLVCAQFSWNKLYGYKACDHCLKSLESAETMARRLTENAELQLPYPECSPQIAEVLCPNCSAKYCSESCRNLALNSYHQRFCCPMDTSSSTPLALLDETWRNIHYPPETASIMLLARLVAMVTQSNSPALIGAIESFCNRTQNEDEELSHKLLGQRFAEQLELLRNRFSEAIYQESWFSARGIRSLFAMLGTNGQGIGTSSIAVWVAKVAALDLSETEREEVDRFIDQMYDDLDRVSGQFIDCEGSGLYTLQSSCNHSCLPNAEVTFPHNDSTLVLKAVEEIDAGDEIFISYLDECERNRSRHSRQKYLRENYLFTCDCGKCVSEGDQPDVTSEEDMSDSDG